MAEFMDRYDKPAYLSKSSLATEDCIWLGIEQPKVKILAVDAAKLGISTTETV
jgi:hypothetical protein